ncbi:response regulator [Litoreibacter roseus]|uniref:Response regulator n=1 Tax=Litoreibacter roseus TaxID=2601869 RepID=A0A6N6JEN6_9RHOB|nr:response regulator [Litoreibacter roseus]GFE64813.1 response regulator [Litoreibacter roseus]
MKTKVLAIDDSRTIRDLLRMSIEAAGFEFFDAVDGVDGIARYNEVKPDVVITDINMPNLDGFGVIDGIRTGTENQNVPILVLTTESAVTLKKRAREAGATGWIVKPFEDESLITVLKRVAGA